MDRRWQYNLFTSRTDYNLHVITYSGPLSDSGKNADGWKVLVLQTKKSQTIHVLLYFIRSIGMMKNLRIKI